MLAIIGQIIRQLREENGISLEELSARAGISVEKLDKIENNQTNPSLGILIKISRALGSRLTTLLDGRGEDHTAVITRRDDFGENPTFAGNEAGKNSHLRFFALAKNKVDRHMEPLVLEVAPCKEVCTEGMVSEHSGEEFLYVLEGEVVLYYATDKFHLCAGDSIYYNSVVPHFLANETDLPAKVLATLYTPY